MGLTPQGLIENRAVTNCLPNSPLRTSFNPSGSVFNFPYGSSDGTFESQLLQRLQALTNLSQPQMSYNYNQHMPYLQSGVYNPSSSLVNNNYTLQPPPQKKLPPSPLAVRQSYSGSPILDKRPSPIRNVDQLQIFGSQQNLTGQSLRQQNLAQQNLGQQSYGHQNFGQSSLGQQSLEQQALGQQSMGQQNLGQQNIGQQNMGQQNFSQQNLNQQNTSHQNLTQLNCGQTSAQQNPTHQQSLGQKSLSQHNLAHLNLSQHKNSNQNSQQHNQQIQSQQQFQNQQLKNLQQIHQAQNQYNHQNHLDVVNNYCLNSQSRQSPQVSPRNERKDQSLIKPLSQMGTLTTTDPDGRVRVIVPVPSNEEDAGQLLASLRLSEDFRPANIPSITRSTSEKVPNRSEMMSHVHRTAWARHTTK